MKTIPPSLLALFFSSVVSYQLLPQSYSIDRYKIVGGGGTSTNGTYSLSGTLGQSDAGGAMSGGCYSLAGGFWAIYAVQTPGLPNLIIYRAGPGVVVAWPNTGSYTLQQNSNLAVADGWVTSNYTINTANDTNSIIVLSLAGDVFFRLKQ